MKQIAVIFILTVFLAQIFSKCIIIASYELNKDYVARVLCENRNKPGMHCNGKCQLRKQLNEDEKKESSVPSQNMKDANQILYFPSSDVVVCCFENIASKKYSLYIEGKSNPHLLSVFHPPTA